MPPPDESRIPSLASDAERAVLSRCVDLDALAAYHRYGTAANVAILALVEAATAFGEAARAAGLDLDEQLTATSWAGRVLDEIRASTDIYTLLTAEEPR